MIAFGPNPRPQSAWRNRVTPPGAYLRLRERRAPGSLFMNELIACSRHQMA